MVDPSEAAIGALALVAIAIGLSRGGGGQPSAAPQAVETSAQRLQRELQQRRESPETFGEPGGQLVSEGGNVTTTAGLPVPGGDPEPIKEKPSSILVSSSGARTTTAGLPEPGGEPTARKGPEPEQPADDPGGRGFAIR